MQKIPGGHFYGQFWQAFPRAGLKNFPGARARVLGKKSTNPAEFCMHYVLKKTCKQLKLGGVFSEYAADSVRRLVGPNPRSALWRMLYLVNIRALPCLKSCP